MRDFAHQTTVRADVREAGDLLSYPRFREGRFELATASERAPLMRAQRRSTEFRVG